MLYFVGSFFDGVPGVPHTGTLSYMTALKFCALLRWNSPMPMYKIGRRSWRRLNFQKQTRFLVLSEPCSSMPKSPEKLKLVDFVAVRMVTCNFNSFYRSFFGGCQSSTMNFSALLRQEQPRAALILARVVCQTQRSSMMQTLQFLWYLGASQLCASGCQWFFIVQQSFSFGKSISEIQFCLVAIVG